MGGASTPLGNFEGTLALLGAGRMGLAMARGWLEGGLPATQLVAIDPKPSEELKAIEGIALLESAAGYKGPAPAVTIVAIKPQMMGEVLPTAHSLFGPKTLVVSIAAGTTLNKLEDLAGRDLAVIRAMPNTPAAIGMGITALCGNAAVAGEQMALATKLMQAVGEVVTLQSEAQMDAVTALSGSGPAYIFHMVECLAATGTRLGLDEATAMRLARATVAGSGALLAQSSDSAAELRQAVTSPGGTTAAALDVLMGDDGLREVLGRALEAAAKRSKELAE